MICRGAVDRASTLYSEGWVFEPRLGYRGVLSSNMLTHTNTRLRTYFLQNFMLFSMRARMSSRNVVNALKFQVLYCNNFFNRQEAWWLKGRASDSSSEGCVFKSRPGHMWFFWQQVRNLSGVFWWFEYQKIERKHSTCHLTNPNIMICRGTVDRASTLYSEGWVFEPRLGYRGVLSIERFRSRLTIEVNGARCSDASDVTTYTCA